MRETGLGGFLVVFTEISAYGRILGMMGALSLTEERS